MMTHQSPMTAESTLVTPSATLPLESAALRVEARGGIARVVLEQKFKNHHADPLAVTYVLPLPADAAVSGFAFTVGERRIEGEVDKKRAARERFEQAIAEGKTAAILEQERSSLFTQELGNVPPGAEVICEITIDQRLRWIDEGSWEWRFPLAAAPRYLGGPGRVADAAKIALEVAQALAPRASLHMAIFDQTAAGRSPESPSHAIQTSNGRVELGGGNRAELDRDVVVRWQVAAMEPSVSANAERTRHADAHALLTIVPPKAEAKAKTVARDLIVLLDTSGSMSGAPLDAARRVAMALVSGLADQDQIELIEFSNSPRRFQKGALFANTQNKNAALAWLAKLQASGGTEMREGILAALQPLRKETQRQVVLITDGLIGFEQEIVNTILEKLPSGSRVHTVGVGSSVNRSLTGPAARAGRGIEVVIGLGEDPERAVARLRARTEQPMVVDVTVAGSALLETAPAQIPDLYAGAPVLVSARIKPEGGTLIVSGRTPDGAWEKTVRVSPNDGTGVLAALFGREAVEDAETRLASGGDRSEIDQRIETLGIEYRIATRLTSWVAIDKTPSVDPRAPTRHESVPQMLPHGMSVEGLGLRQSAANEARYMSTRSGMILQGAGGFGRAVPGAGPPPPPMARPAAPMGRAAPPPRREAEEERTRSTSIQAPREDDEADLFEPAAPAAESAPSTLPPAPEQAARPRKKGLIGSAIDALFGAGEKAKRETPDVVRGRVVSRKGKEIVIDLEILEELDWDDAALAAVLARVWFDDGTEIAGKVDVSKTSSAAHLVRGQHVKLVIVLDEEPTRAARFVRFEPDTGLYIPLT
jgi:Ca-activated chloride channel family protein